MNDKNTKIIGLAGSFASGKDTLAHYLADNFGYLHISTGDMLREETQKLYGTIERPILHKHAEELRYKEGAGVLVEKALQAYEAQKDKCQGVVITGLRSLGEAKAISVAGGFLVFVDAPTEVRYQRMISRNRDNETKLTLEEFAQNEQQEWHQGDGDADFNLMGIKKMADIEIDNTKDTQTFLSESINLLGLKNR